MTKRYEPLAEVVRSGFVEGCHWGAVAVVDADGALVASVGDPLQPIYPRSTAKLLQAAGMLDLGLEVPDDHLALVCASHHGQQPHVDGVRAILAGVGLDESALQCTPKLPQHAPSARAVVRGGGAEAPVWADCSGKHAGMLATCVRNGWTVDDYLSPGHPLQVGLRATFADVTGTDSPHDGTDGCGAPIWTCRLDALAAAFARAVTADAGSSLRRAADAMRARPDLVGGTDSEVTCLMQGVPGLLVKDGAEAVYAAALPDGTGVAVKVADGGFRAGQVALVAVLRQLGSPTAATAPWATVPVLGHGRPVGEVRPLPVVTGLTRTD